MNDERDEVLDELRALMAVDASSGFAARVQREVEARTRPVLRVWWVKAAATAVAVVAVALVTRPSLVTRSNPVGNSTPHQPKVAETAAPATAPAVPAAVSQPAPVRARVSVARTPQHPGRGEPEVLVPPEQAAALNRLMAAVRDGRTVLAPAAHDDGPLVIELLPTVAPIDVSRLPGDPADDVPPDIDSRKAGNHVSTQV